MRVPVYRCLRLLAWRNVPHNVAIVTDSTADLSPGLAASLGIDVVPIRIRFDGREYRDGVDLQRADFYAKLRAAAELPQTSPPPAQAFGQVFERHLRAGREVVCVVVSSKLSQTYANAVEAAAAAGGTVHVVDGKSASSGTGLLATGAARLAQQGAAPDAIAQAVARWIGTQRGYTACPDLTNLGRSGRLNKAQVLLGTLMNVVPIIRIDKDGTLVGEATVRSFEKAKEMIVDIALRNLDDHATARIAVTHANDPALGAHVLEELRAKLRTPPRELSLHEAGPTIAANVGAGAVAISFLHE